MRSSASRTADLGARACSRHAKAQGGPVLVIGTDCRGAVARAAASGARMTCAMDGDVSVISAEDGGYV
jgi:glycosyltransferase A (GT-A) superfamily protein (DUF2064 family)